MASSHDIDNYEHDPELKARKVSVVGFEATSYSVVTEGPIKTITESDGTKTRITIIDSTNPNNKIITTEWI